jgi:PAS domain-containing protein
MPPDIERALSGEAIFKISALMVSVMAALKNFSSSIILTTILGSLLAAGYAWYIACRAKTKNSAENYGHERFYQSLIRNSKLPIAILDLGLECPISFCGGTEILIECLADSNAVEVAKALDALLSRGVSFETVLRASNDRKIFIYGAPVGRCCAVYFCIAEVTEERSTFRDILNAVPIPVWIRKMDLSIDWVNKAFLSVFAAPISDKRVALEHWEGNLATEALNGIGSVTGRRSVVANGRHRHFQMNLSSLPKSGLVGMAIDIADVRSVEMRLQLTAKAFADVIEHIPLAMAVFDEDQNLAIYNRNYARLWDFSESWLRGSPSKGEIIDRLRDERKLPEQKDFLRWKRSQLLPLADADMVVEELWHLPGGKSLRAITQPYLEGGQLILFEDVSERLILEASLNRLAQVQRATLDALEEAVAIFGPDGRLVLHNSNFAELWRLSPLELSKRPHCADIAKICDGRTGRNEVWQVISDGVSAVVPAAPIKAHEIRRGDSRHVSLTLSRLPDGTTMAIFCDFSDFDRFEAMLEEDRSARPDSSSQLPRIG